VSGADRSSLADWRREVDRELDRLLAPAPGIPPRLLEAMRHAVFAGGKRLRPLLALAAAEAAGGEPRIALPVAAGLEMIHTYSLVHDDLPAMDNDDLRRGKPTVHVVFGEALAILAGDGLLTRALEVLASEPGPGEIRPDNPRLEEAEFAARRARVVALVADAAGPAGMVGGQADDLEATGAAATPGDASLLNSIHRRKTGALITASLLAGAVTAGANESVLDRLRCYGEAVGLAFQIVDDILDVESTTEVLGKSAGKDQRDTKLTFPTLLGIEASRRRVEELRQTALDEVARLGPGAARLGELAGLIASRSH